MYLNVALRNVERCAIINAVSAVDSKVRATNAASTTTTFISLAVTCYNYSNCYEYYMIDIILRNSSLPAHVSTINITFFICNHPLLLLYVCV